jgi:hypothetical protein
MEVTEYSLTVPKSASTISVALSTSTASSAPIHSPSAVVLSTVDCFVIRSAAPGASTAATTSCMPILANIAYRMKGWEAGDRLSGITASGSGTLYITPDA